MKKNGNKNEICDKHISFFSIGAINNRPKKKNNLCKKSNYKIAKISTKVNLYDIIRASFKK